MPATSSQYVFRDLGSPGVGVVGRFLNIAPQLLHGGRSVQTPPLVPREDWWAKCIDSELVVHVAAQQEVDSAEAPTIANWWADLIQTELLGPRSPTNLQTTGLASVLGGWSTLVSPASPHEAGRPLPMLQEPLDTALAPSDRTSPPRHPLMMACARCRRRWRQRFASRCVRLCSGTPRVYAVQGRQ